VLYCSISYLCIKTVSFNGHCEYVVPESVFDILLKAAVKSIKVDEVWYLEKYPDVNQGVKEGGDSNAADHYRRYGYKENRQPHPIAVDQDYYLETNPDVAEALKLGLVKSAQDHFDGAGFAEGRLPYATYSLFQAEQ